LLQHAIVLSCNFIILVNAHEAIPHSPRTPHTPLALLYYLTYTINDDSVACTEKPA
jgi:hypothetical protein